MAVVTWNEHGLAGLNLMCAWKRREKGRCADKPLLAAVHDMRSGQCSAQVVNNPVDPFAASMSRAWSEGRVPSQSRLRRILSGIRDHWMMLPYGLRIDVDPSQPEIERELEALYRRLYRRGDTLCDLPAIDVDFPEMLFRYREADGEHYIYVEDLKEKKLAGYTVFNRLVELDRRADRYLRATHSKYAAPYQRRGIATAIYTWWLDAGHCLISGARQSTGANALWQALGRRYDLFYVDLRSKQLSFQGWRIEPHVQEALHTRMILLGKGWNTSGFAEATGMQMSQQPRKAEHRPLNRALVCGNEAQHPKRVRDKRNSLHLNETAGTS